MANPFPFVSGDVLTAAEMNGIGETLTWTPSFTNLTLGNGTVTGRYVRVQNLVFTQFKLVFGSTTSITALNPTFTLPITANTTALTTLENAQGWLVLRDANVGNFYGWVNFLSSTTATFVAGLASGTYLAPASINATTPFTWTTSDQLVTNFCYEAV
jgi:hypothetical protein